MDTKRCDRRLFDELNTFDKCPAGTIASSFGGVSAEGDCCNTRRFRLGEVALEASVEVKLGKRNMARFGFPQTDKAATFMKVTAFIWVIYLFILAKKEAYKIGAVGYQYMAAGNLFFAEKDIYHEGFVVHLVLIRSSSGYLVMPQLILTFCTLSRLTE
jgi:hypothetical protein